MRKLLISLLIVSFFNVILANVEAISPLNDPIQTLNKLETEVTGKVVTNVIIERLNNLEQLLCGRNYEDSIAARLMRLQNILYTNRPHDISLIYKMQAVEWVLFHEGDSGSLVSRVEKSEVLLFGKVYGGSLNKRLEGLINQVFPEGVVKGQWVDIPEGTLIKISLKNKLSSKEDEVGKSFDFEIAETVINNSFVLFMKGISGTGLIQQLKKPAIFGKDAQIVLDFNQIRTFDGTEVELTYGTKASQGNRSFKWAVGASAAGMLALGPGGILTGILIKGRHVEIPEGSELYLQVKSPVRIYTIKEFENFYSKIVKK